MSVNQINTNPNGNNNARERDVRQLNSTEWQLSNANTISKTNLDERQMNRTAAIVRDIGDQKQFLPDNAATYRIDTEERNNKEIADFDVTSARIIERFERKLKSIEDFQKLVFDDANPAAVDPKKFPGDPAVLSGLDFGFVKTQKDNLKTLTDDMSAIQGILKNGTDKKTVREEIQKKWNIALPAGDGLLDPAFKNDVQNAVSREYAKQVAEFADKFVAQVDAVKNARDMSLADIAKEIDAESLKKLQSQRDILLTQQPERAAFLNRVGGVPTPEQLIEMATDPKTKTIDIAYLAYCIRFATDAKKFNDANKSDAQIEVEALQRAIGNNNLFIAATPDIQKKITEYIQKWIKVPNPSGASPQNLLMRMRFPKDVVDDIVKDKQLLDNLPLQTLLHLRRGLKPGTEVRAALVDTLKNGNLLKEDFINILTFLRFPVGQNKEWKNVKKEAQTFYEESLLKKGIVEEEKNSTKIILKNGAGVLALETGTFNGNMGDIAKRIATEKIEDLPWEKDVEFIAKSVSDVAANGFKYWSEYVQKIPDDFKTTLPGDDQLKKDIKDRSLLVSASSSLKGLLQQRDKDNLLVSEAKTVADKTVAYDKERTDLKASRTPSRYILSQHADASDLVEVSRHVHDELQEKFGINTRPVEQQDIAFWLAMHKSMDAAGQYLSSPKPDINTVGLTPDEMVLFREYLQTLFIHQQLKGTDALLGMKQNLGLRIHPLAVEIMQKTTDKKGIPLSMGDARMEQWFVKPEDSIKALSAVVVGDPGPKTALINAFALNKPQTYVTAAGETKTVNPSEARAMVQHIWNHLNRQKQDYTQSVFQSQRKERFNQPLDILRKGKDAVFDMLRSGDRVQQGLAITLIVSAGWAIYRTWTRGGNIGKGLLLSVPLFFGGDAVLRKVTGKGFTERLGLQMMNDEDAGSAVEQFRRKYEVMPKYDFLQEPSGIAAIRALTNPEQKVPVATLLQWRKTMDGGSRPSYRKTLPKLLVDNGALSAVVNKMAGLDKSNRARAQVEEEASRYLYRAFEALCEEVAEQNNLTEPRATRGAKLIYDRYVTCNDPLLGEYAAELRGIARSRKGYDMLEVMVYERATPTMNEALLQNPTALEKLLKGTGIALEEAQDKLGRSWALAEIFAFHGVQVAPEYAEAAQAYLYPKMEAMYEYLKVVYVKNKQAVTSEFDAALRLTSNTLYQLGVILTADGPEFVQATWEGAVWGGRKTVDMIQNTYRVLHKNGIVTGPAIDALDRASLAITGMRVTDLVLFESAMDSPDPVVLDTHVEKLAESVQWKTDFLAQLNTVTTGVTELQLDSWIAEVQNELGTAGTNDPYKIMASYELVKRRVYSYILHKRGGNPVKIPFNAETIAGMKEDGKQIESVYGLVSLRLLKSEPNEWKVREWDYLPDMANDPVDFILNTIPQSTIQRAEARQYLVALDEFYTEFKRSAEYAFPVGMPDRETKLKQYDAFLQTVLTNAVLDMTLAQTAGQEGLNKNTLPRDSAVPTLETAKPFELMISQAQGFLDFLRAERGNSPDAMKLKDMDLKAFAESGDIRNLNMYIPKPARAVPLAPKAGPLSQEEIDGVERALATGNTDPLTLAALLPGLQPSYADRPKIVQRFDEAADEVMSKPVTEETMPQALVALQGTEKRKELRDHILKSREGDRSKLASEAAEAKKGSFAPDVLNDLIDHASIRELDALLKEIQQSGINDVVTNPERGTWEVKLLRLYKAAETPRVRDVVSQLLEYVKYQIKHNADPDENGRTGYAKYLTYLTRAGTDAPPENAWYFSSGHAKARMSISPSGVTSAALNATWSGLVTDKLKSNSVGDKMKILKRDMGY